MANPHYNEFQKFWEETDPKGQRMYLPDFSVVQTGAEDVGVYHCIFESQLFLACGKETRWVEWFRFSTLKEDYYLSVYDLTDKHVLHEIRSRWQSMRNLGNGRKIGNVHLGGFHLFTGMDVLMNYQKILLASKNFKCREFSVRRETMKEMK